MTLKSPSLEVVSSTTVEKRRLARINLTSEQFRYKDSGKIFSVFDLSKGGMALRILDADDRVHFPLGRRIEGTLNLKRHKFDVVARVKRIGSDLIGCEFEELSSEALSALQEFFDPVALGQELKPVDTEIGGPLWFHGRSGTDLLVWRRVDGQFSRFVLYLMGSYIQWDDAHRVSTGRVDSSQERGEVWGEFRFETLLLQPDLVPDTGKLKVAKTLILSSNLPQDLKRWSTRQLEV